MLALQGAKEGVLLLKLALEPLCLALLLHLLPLVLLGGGGWRGVRDPVIWARMPPGDPGP